MIYVMATIEIREGRRDAFLEAFRRIVPKVRAEEGCLEYVPTIEVETQMGAIARPRPNVVTVVEKWESLTALEAHLVAPHMSSYREEVRDLVERATIRVTEPAD